ncbi:sarcoplasmic calcium-binding proteins I, III, and IV-like isoform X2 [Watersipora subatra]
MTSLTEFQKRKLEHLYDLFYDVNSDGKVDWNDFLCSLEKIAKINKWDAESEKKKSSLETLKMIWESLKQKADKNSDGIVSHDEWLLMWSDCAEAVIARQEFPYWLSAYMAFMFDCADTSGDEVIDKEEYRNTYSEFGLSAEQCDKAYDQFTDGEKLSLDRESFSKLWHEYFLSEDVTAKGNALFGKSDW